MMNLLHIIGAFFLDILETIIVALAIFVVIYLFLFQPHQVKGASMEPNFHDGEYILTDKISYRFGAPKRGDIVIFRAPRNPELDFIKRVIGEPGDRVKISNGKVLVNDVQLKEQYLSAALYTHGGAFLTDNSTFTVPEKAYFVLGDNRDHSSDSREWGPVPVGNLIGKAFFRYWPPTRLGILPHASYK